MEAGRYGFFKPCSAARCGFGVSGYMEAHRRCGCRGLARGFGEFWIQSARDEEDSKALRRGGGGGEGAEVRTKAIVLHQNWQRDDEHTGSEKALSMRLVFWFLVNC